MSLVLNLPQYRSHKIVRAAKITAISDFEPEIMVDGGTVGGTIVVGLDWLRRHQPQVGGYFVQYDDGYSSFSPAKAFEEGYTRLGDPITTQAALNAALEASPSPNRITPESIKAKIAAVAYTVLPDSTTTICKILMANGFSFIGKSACADPANFDQEIGKKVAYDDAFRQIWSHEGYLLRERLSITPKG